MRSSSLVSKRILWGLVALATLLCLGFLASIRQPVYAQIAGAHVPDLVGTWEGSFSDVCQVPNVWNPDANPPMCATLSGTGSNLIVTQQSGRVFLGRHPSARDRFTGYVASDGTVSIHYFSPSEHEQEHAFLTGKMGIEKGKLVIRGYLHGFSELPMPLIPNVTPPERYPPYTQTAEYSLTKQ